MAIYVHIPRNIDDSSVQVGIQFVQIGSSPQAAQFLRELDDSLGGMHGVRVSGGVCPRNVNRLLNS